MLYMIVTHCTIGHYQISAPTPRSLMKVGVPLGNRICHVLNECVPLGTAPGYAPKYASETGYFFILWNSKSQGNL